MTKSPGKITPHKMKSYIANSVLVPKKLEYAASNYGN